MIGVEDSYQARKVAAAGEDVKEVAAAGEDSVWLGTSVMESGANQATVLSGGAEKHAANIVAEGEHEPRPNDVPELE